MYWLSCDLAMPSSGVVWCTDENSFQRDTDTGENRARLRFSTSGVRSEPCSTDSLTATGFVGAPATGAHQDTNAART